SSELGWLVCIFQGWRFARDVNGRDLCRRINHGLVRRHPATCRTSGRRRCLYRRARLFCWGFGLLGGDVWGRYLVDRLGVSPRHRRPVCALEQKGPKNMSSLLSVQGLTRRFGGNVAVAGIDFDVQAGELLALIGPNGAGKSTTFNMINGQLPATSGSVQLDGREILGMASHKVARLGVGRSFQIAATFSSLTVRQNVQMALIANQGRTFSFFRKADEFQPEKAMALLELVGMQDMAQHPCHELAYGDVKRLELAMSLAGDPRLLLMDEPTAGMGAAE